MEYTLDTFFGPNNRYLKVGIKVDMSNHNYTQRVRIVGYFVCGDMVRMGPMNFVCNRRPDHEGDHSPEADEYIDQETEVFQETNYNEEHVIDHAGFLRPIVEMTAEDDYLWNLQASNNPTPFNLLQASNAMAGEVGEVCNVVKKIIRDGDSLELRDQLKEEVVDVMIYIAKILIVGGIDFSEAYDDKHRRLHVRWNERGGTPVDERHFDSTRPTNIVPSD